MRKLNKYNDILYKWLEYYPQLKRYSPLLNRVEVWDHLYLHSHDSRYVLLPPLSRVRTVK